MDLKSTTFSTDCSICPRLSKFLEQISTQYPKYYSKPVPSFGSANPELLIIGLAPGLHGANATGRPFTGDHAGIMLYEMLYKYGFSNKSKSIATNDGLRLKKCRITNAVRCLPPQNKPIGEEINNCNRYLSDELNNISNKAVILCLGQIAHRSALKAMFLKQSEYPFAHGKFYNLEGGKVIVDSYHCSRYNTQTKRLTEPMFSDIFMKITEHLKS